ncbi:polysaccharide biosynthesis/export family protein [Salinisphaera sp. P385]|uniref:Polysaccharide biosynthesis/export family protein n=1 Tax=Spectribacter acetivorans TaxID=3075603 RepID=A0ABU3BCY6_9GAMM|nr:polysaccharide biosynthesis/export family protein [Salinisphaera sp. P385]MDT0619880.1 polysaccharide biosynthesis/export family protein [Salinisphaera sp. P385]
MNRVAASLTTLLLLSACSFPGMRVDIGEEQESTWFSSGDPRQSETGQPVHPEYDATVRRITPSLVADLQREDAANPSADTRLPTTDENGYPQYRVGKGDILSVIVYGHQELTNPAGTTESVASSGRVVDARGKIYFPFIGDMDVAGLTTEEIRGRIADGLDRVIRDPQVDVRVIEFRSKQVFVSGDIQSPCRVPVTDIPMTVDEALSQCQSLSSGGGSGGSGSGGLYTGKALRLIRDGQSYPINLATLHSGADEFWLKAGDRLVLDENIQKVFLLGEFQEQLAIPVGYDGITLADAVTGAGGLDLATADSSKIYVIRGLIERRRTEDDTVVANLNPMVYQLDAKSPQALILAHQFELQPRDVVYASAASLVNFNRALAEITPTLNLLFQSFLIFDRSNN